MKEKPMIVIMPAKVVNVEQYIKDGAPPYQMIP